MRRRFAFRAAALAAFLVGLRALASAQPDPLPSWNDTAPKRAILKFVADTTAPGSPAFVPPDERRGPRRSTTMAHSGPSSRSTRSSKT